MNADSGGRESRSGRCIGTTKNHVLGDNVRSSSATSEPVLAERQEDNFLGDVCFLRFQSRNEHEADTVDAGSIGLPGIIGRIFGVHTTGCLGRRRSWNSGAVRVWRGLFNSVPQLEVLKQLAAA
jgi:hypothetical protein